MKKNLKYFVIWWAILFAMFNAVVFIVTGSTVGLGSVGSVYWISYAAIVLSFAGLLLCAIKAFHADAKGLLYNASVIKLTYSNLVALLIVGGLFMVLNFIPGWIGAVVCILIVGFNAMKVVQALAAAENVTDKDKAVKQQTAFIKLLTADAQALVATSSEKALAQKVYEAIRYSDPMSAPELASAEEKIQAAFDKFSENPTQENADAVLNAVQARNIKCKVLK